ncbi:MAG: D-glycero-beta-D-manno-heptose 1-phosphate adenylyltransferase [Candidatus Omnitrophica bacterium]|nr:D-glycero-beta-D-manno-heptose 1-phosphate adenylyltransferase [Candidatus Omnitrophota bacterium]
MIDAKIKTVAELSDIVERLKTQGKQVVFTNGCFDLLHVGHIRYLEQARQLGGCLIVAVNSDRSAKSLQKGADRPLVGERDRAQLVAALASVDYVTIFDEPTPLALIETLLPAVLVKGGDWRPEQIVGREAVEAHGGRVVSVPLVEGYSTTALVARLRGVQG